MLFSKTFFYIFILIRVSEVFGFARLLEPLSRASLWRHGYKTPKDEFDDQCNCGGYWVHWNVNSGKCGICGDPYDAPQPRHHELGGRYLGGIITKKYKQGELLTTYTEIAGNQGGFIQFRICNISSKGNDATQECFNQNVLNIAGASEHNYKIPSGDGTFVVYLELPPHMVCAHCVLQWEYITSSFCGTCENGSTAVGCGAQMLYRNCADIEIVPRNAVKSTTTSPQVSLTTKYVRKKCIEASPAKVGKGIPGMKDWCMNNCVYASTPYCPENYCMCVKWKNLN